MCGRFANPFTGATLAQELDAAATARIASWRARWNAAPTQHLPVVRRGADGGRMLDLLAWGWKPEWMRSGLLVNARGEEAAGKRTFAAALHLRRCLVPVQAFYEWRETDRQPYAFARPDRAPYVIGGLWDPAGAAGEASFLLLTVPANATVAPVHHRMPLIVPRLRWDRWLDPATPPLEVEAMIAPADDDAVEGWPVSRDVGAVANDRPELLAPAQGG